VFYNNYYGVQGRRRAWIATITLSLSLGLSYKCHLLTSVRSQSRGGARGDCVPLGKFPLPSMPLLLFSIFLGQFLACASLSKFLGLPLSVLSLIISSAATASLLSSLPLLFYTSEFIIIIFTEHTVTDPGFRGLFIIFEKYKK